MPEFTAHRPGTFCWIELVTSDAPAALDFYSGLFGWSAIDSTVPYVMLLQKGKAVSALYQRSAEQAEQGLPPHWASYVAVDDVDASLAQAAKLGGRILVESKDVFDVGRMGVLQDPSGAYLSLWQARAHIGAQLKDEHGSLCWTELMTRDTEAAERFYRKLFGWDSRLSGIGEQPYTEFLGGDRQVAGMMPFPSGIDDVPPHWLAYFAVDDCDASAARTLALGGGQIVPPQEIPGVGRFAVLCDPQGAVFGVVAVGTA